MDEKMDNEKLISKIIAKAIEIGAKEIEIEYKDGYEEVYARNGDIGFCIEMIKSSSEDASKLRDELYSLRKRKTMKIFDEQYEIKVDIYNNFGEDAYRIKFKNLTNRFKKSIKNNIMN